MFYRDQGLQYTSYNCRKVLRNLGIKQSFFNPGTPYDNAVAESFFSIMKREELLHNCYHSFKEFEDKVSEFIAFFNTILPHQKMKGLTPCEVEDNYWKEFDLSS